MTTEGWRGTLEVKEEGMTLVGWEEEMGLAEDEGIEWIRWKEGIKIVGVVSGALEKGEMT